MNSARLLRERKPGLPYRPAPGAGAMAEPDRICSREGAAAVRIRRCLDVYRDSSIRHAQAVEDGKALKKAKGVLDKELPGLANPLAVLQARNAEGKKVFDAVEAVYALAREPDPNLIGPMPSDPGRRYLLNIIRRATGDDETAKVRAAVEAVCAEAAMSNERRTRLANEALGDARVDLLDKIDDMEALHRTGGELTAIGRALEIIYTDARLIGSGFNPALKARAKTLLAQIEAAGCVRGIIEELRDSRSKLLERRLGEVSVLVEREEHELARQALGIIVESGDARTALAARVLEARMKKESAMPIPEETAAAARENIARLMASVASANGTDRFSKLSRGQSVTNLALAHGDMLVLEAARNTPSGKPEDMALLRGALDIVISDHQGASRELAAELMKARLDRGGQ